MSEQSEERKKGNLGLCQIVSCLNTAPTGEGIVKSRFQEAGNPAIKWLFEDGLLRALDSDGFATDRCLGPNVSTIVDVAGGQVAPYELALQDCPETPKENIFAHDFMKPRTAEDRVDELGRHMRFLVLGDGRIQSLAPVRGSHSSFCVSAINWDGLGVTNAYLTPCLEDEDDQVFAVDPESSFEPFLLNWQSEDERMVEFAYQLGFDGASSNPEGFESFAIKVTSDTDSSFLSETTLPGGSDPKSGTLSLSLDDLNVTDTKVFGRLEAHLLGISRGGLESRWLASTAFNVSESAYDVVDSGRSSPFSTDNTDDNIIGRIGDMVGDEGAAEVAKGFPKSMIAVVVFLGIMAFYLILVKANSIFCPTKRTQQKRRIKNKRRQQEKRNSEHTAATMEDAVNRMMNGEADWGRTSLDSMGSILFRITEELDPEDIEDATSTDGEEPMVISDAENTASDTTFDTEETNSSGETNDVESPQ